MGSKPLTETSIRALKPAARAFKVSDGGGLHILVTPAGSKIWRLVYRAGGRQRCMTLGAYPKLTLANARKQREDAKAMLRSGSDPGASAATPVGEKTFAEVALDWHSAQSDRWTLAYAQQVKARIEADLFPELGKLPIGSMARSQLLSALRKVEGRGTLETARRLKQYAGAIFRYAGAEDDALNDPTPMLRGALKAPPRSRHHVALKHAEIGAFMRVLGAYDGETTTRLAIALILHTAVRTGELIAARWTEFEALETPDRTLWRIPAERMKMRTEHLVPLTGSSIAILEELKRITGGGGYLFPAADGRSGHISNNTMLFALYRMGYRGRTTIHGFRRTFSTAANEHGWPADHIEMQLAHDERDSVRGAYNAAQYLAGRRAIMDWWSGRLVGFEDAQVGSDQTLLDEKRT